VDDELFPMSVPEACCFQEFQPMRALDAIATVVHMFPNAELGQWDTNSPLYIHAEACGTYGFLSSMETNFHYQLSGGVQLEALNWKPIWEPSAVATVRGYHEMMTYQTGPVVVAVVRLKEFKVEGDRVFELDLPWMARVAAGEQAEETPQWLMEVHRNVERLRCLEAQIACNAPTVPAPNPMKLQAVFSEEVAHRDTCEALSLVGVGALRLMAVLSSCSDHPWDNARHLEERADALLDDRRLAQLMMDSGLPLVCGCSIDSMAQASLKLKALAGAHLLEADFFAVAKLWKWLTGEDELGRALLHLGGSARFCGRTPTYSELWEGTSEQLARLLPPWLQHRIAEEGDSMDELWLLVSYAEQGDALYRRSGPRGEELLLGAESEWTPVSWDHELETFCSSLQKDDGTLCPLPTKVRKWLRGAAFGAVARVKKNSDVASCYSDVWETCDAKLHVRFLDHGVLKYSRSANGGLGFEEDKEGRVHTVGFSEEKKALVSLRLGREAIPNRLADWLMGVRSLAQLVPAKRAGEPDHGNTRSLQLTDEGAVWTTDSGARVYSKVELGDTGNPVFFSRVEGQSEFEVFCYSEERKRWELKNGGPVPPDAVSHLVRKIDDLFSLDTVSAQLGLAPWLQAHSGSLKSFFHLSSLNLLEVQQALQRAGTFRNPQLLAEALTHGSKTAATSSSSDRLAVLGEAAVQCYVAQELTRHAAFLTAATATHNDNADTISEEFVVPVNVSYWEQLRAGKTGSTTPSPSRTGSIAGFRQRMAACCNHVSYAYTCVRLGLHQMLQHDSNELGMAVRRFARAVDRGATWEELLGLGSPKALGDMLLACVGAVILDGGSCEADRLLEKHMELCHHFQPLLVDAQEVKPEDCSVEGLLEAIRRAGPTICGKVLAPPPPRGSFGKCCSMEPCDAQLQLASALTDVHLCVVDGRHTGGVSPRTTALRSLVASPREDVRGSVGSSPPESVGAAEGDEGTAKTGSDEGEGVAYCEVCDMSLNGPQQLADHKFGKKHLKNYRRAQQLGEKAVAEKIKGKVPDAQPSSKVRDTSGPSPRAPSASNFAQDGRLQPLQAPSAHDIDSANFSQQNNFNPPYLTPNYFGCVRNGPWPDVGFSNGYPHIQQYPGTQ